MSKNCHNVRLNPLSAIFTKQSNTLKQFVGKLPTNCLSVLDHFVGLALKRLTSLSQSENANIQDLILAALTCDSFTKQGDFIKIQASN